MPHYEVVAPADKRVALDDAPEIKVVVYNRGLLGGTYSAAYSVDGKQADAVSFPLGGGQGREMTLSLPGGTERGPVLLSLGGASVEAQAVMPPAFAVAPLQVDPSPAKLRTTWCSRPASRTPATSPARSAASCWSTAMSY